MIVKAPWDPGTTVGGRQKASQNIPGPRELAQGFEGPRMGWAGSGGRSVLANPIQGLTLGALGWDLGPPEMDQLRS